MTIRSLAAAATLTAAALSAPATAQSSLGVVAGELSFGQSSADGAGAFFEAMIDVSITEHHGLQGHLGYSDIDGGDIGSLAGVVYMTPRPGQKYGLTFMLSDVDDRSLTYGQFGAAGMFSLTDTLDIEVRGGIGEVFQNGLDWLTVGVGVHYRPSADWHLYAQYDIAEFEEAGLDAFGHVATIGARYSPEGQAWAVFAEVSRDEISGHPRGDGETVARVGFALTWGAPTNGQPAFRVSDPARQLLRRGLY
ncbi:outer membrane beta-barrel protein [Rhodobacterales bacterium HKCCE2091]|nr:outer membrane beta-barrel protein [Rhodobacterales bacterium HKCCE2091]